MRSDSRVCWRALMTDGLERPVHHTCHASLTAFRRLVKKRITGITVLRPMLFNDEFVALAMRAERGFHGDVFEDGYGYSDLN